MKLCQRCLNAVANAAPLGNTWVVGNDRPEPPETFKGFVVHLVSESECEFWAHKELNQLQARLTYDWSKSTEETTREARVVFVNLYQREKPVPRTTFVEELAKKKLPADEVIDLMFREALIYESKPGYIRPLGAWARK